MYTVQLYGNTRKMPFSTSSSTDDPNYRMDVRILVLQGSVTNDLQQDTQYSTVQYLIIVLKPEPERYIDYSTSQIQ